MNVGAVGEYIRKQRESSRLSLRKMAGLAGVSIPYLSQVERGLRKPSADILQAIAKGLRISAETLYVQAGILEDRPVPDVATAIMSDPTISERQKQALVQIYQAFRDEGRVQADGGDDRPQADTGPDTNQESSAKAKPAPRGHAHAGSRSLTGGGARTPAPRSPHPARPRSSASKPGKEV